MLLSRNQPQFPQFPQFPGMMGGGFGQGPMSPGAPMGPMSPHLGGMQQMHALTPASSFGAAQQMHPLSPTNSFGAQQMQGMTPQGMNMGMGGGGGWATLRQGMGAVNAFGTAGKLYGLGGGQQQGVEMVNPSFMQQNSMKGGNFSPRFYTGQQMSPNG